MIELEKVKAGVELEARIVEYLISKGKIRACLLHKLLKRFCSSKSSFKVNKSKLISKLASMVKTRKIEIIITEPFDVNWKVTLVNSFKFLNDGKYITRIFHEWNEPNIGDIPRMDYLFDSRRIDFANAAIVDESLAWLKTVIKKVPRIKYKMMIYLPEESRKLNIYEELEEAYKLDFTSIDPPKNLFYSGPKLDIPLEDQKDNLKIVQAYRSNYMCLYITLIEVIQEAIVKVQDINEDMLKEFVRKFAFYCIMFVRSDWVELTKGNPYRWETFFKAFKLPFKILNLEFKTIKFHGRTFETTDRYRYCIFIKNKNIALIQRLKRLGYEEFKEENTKNMVAIGMDHDIYIPCPTIEHFFFVFKYICYYHAFLIFHHSFDYMKEIRPEFRFSRKEELLHEVFYPVMSDLFNIKSGAISKTLVFKYYTLDSRELEIIYNSFMVSRIKNVETKLFKYFMLKYSMFRNAT
jgi:hypothetical protein